MWLYEHAVEIGIDRDRIGIGGDSAGGTLAVTSCLMARDIGHSVKPLFQMLIYPFLDNRSQSESFMRYTDTPVWNSTLSKAVKPLIDPHPEDTPLAYRSPVEAETLEGMPPAYIEVAEFDALRDDGILYSKLLEEAGIEVEFHDTEGTMHGFDYMMKAPTTQKMESLRISDLVISGRHIGEEIMKAGYTGVSRDQGSVIVILATDVPLTARQLARVSRRAQNGIARTGNITGSGSGEIVISMSTARRISHYPDDNNSGLCTYEYLHEDYMDIVFTAVCDAVEESVISSLIHAEINEYTADKVSTLGDWL